MALNFPISLVGKRNTYIQPEATYVYDASGTEIDSVVGNIPSNWKNGNGLVKSVEFGSSTLIIGSSAFRQCGLAGGLHIPSTLRIIRDRAFYYNFTTLTGTCTIEEGLTTIEDYGLGRTGFTGTLRLPSTITTLGIRAFWDKSSFTRIEIASVNAPSLGLEAFKGSGAGSATSYPDIHVPSNATGYTGGNWNLHTIIYDLPAG
jgi:hypothetical protein